MRIQHNILAMNAYRNYNTNTSALAKNLEKLSSGYKINRAGDDAAGLAISEKMRAQITGLNAAQKNVKDGISLVKTAEGAMQEIQDMLNRMDYLATQSANGTYDDPVDRLNLQKEVDALKTEINRIAESANFNGIKLLDGSLDTSEAVTKEVTDITEAVTTTGDSVDGLLPPKGDKLSLNTVLHKESNTGKGGTTFSVDLHNTVFGNNAANADTGAAADKLTIKVGDQTWELEGNGNGALEGKELAQAIVDKINENADGDGNVVIDGFKGQKFKVSLGEGGDNRITFQQVNAPSGEEQVVDGDMKVEITGNIGSGTASAGTPAVKAKYTIDLSNATNTTIRDQAGIEAAAVAAGGTAGALTDAQIDAATSKIDGVNVVWDGNIDKTMQKFVADYNAWKDPTTGNTKNYTASWDGKVLTMEAKVAGALDNTAAGDGTTVPTVAPTLANVGQLTQNKEAVKEVQTLDLTGAGQADVAAKTIDGVAIDWNTDLDTTMKAFVEKYNKESSKDYTAEWADGKLTMTAKVAGKADGTSTEADAPTAAPSTNITYAPATKGVYAFDISIGTNKWADGDTLEINGSTYTYDADGADGTLNAAAVADNDSLAKFVASKLSSNDYDISVDGNTVKFTAKKAGTLADTGTVAAALNMNASIADDTGNGTGAAGSGTDSASAANVAQTAAGAAAGTPGFVQVTAGDDAGVTAAAPAAFTEDTVGAAANGDGVVVIGTADYNFKTTAIKNVGAEAGGRLASTYFDLTEEMVNDGGSFQIGKTSYKFSSDAADEGAENTVYIGDLVDADGNLDIAGNLDEIAQRITDAAKGNSTWTVGHDKGGSTLSFVENQNQTDYSGDDALTSVENIAKTFSWTTAEKSETHTETITKGGEGDALTLQIGDTSDKFNQLNVSVGDMHTTAMGTGKITLDGKEIEVTKTIEDINIGSLEGAQEAVAVIKNAINYVSGVRGDLGAVQNRLEHTQNNLSVMAENIQDAESTIRDTDIAEEMMAYTKNNILIQSAQAMLAQANAVPQGVLQLLG